MFETILRKLREDSGLTQSELAQALNLTDATIGNYEQGLRKPRNDTLKAIAKYFNVSVDYLLGFENNTTLSYGGSEGKTIRADEFTYALFKEAETLSETEKAAILAMAKFYNEQKNIKK